LRVVFFGSPEFAVPTLQALATSPAFEVVLAVTQGAKDASSVERAAIELGIPVYKPATLRDAVSRDPLLAADADLFVVAAFGLIFRQRTLDIPRLGSINVHPSVLPSFRGASPIASAIALGRAETGVSLMLMDSGIDTGAVVSVERATINAEDTTESLGARLAIIGAGQAARDIPRWAAGELTSVPQKTKSASLTRTLTKADGWIDWTKPAIDIERHIRAMWPWPRAWTTIRGVPIQVHVAQLTDVMTRGTQPGAIISARKHLIVACGDSALELVTLEPAGRRSMPARAYLNGLRVPVDQLGDSGKPTPQPPLVVPVET
jgi:methionyl-tRNA formyltransferase